jgi:hypothetical protein
MQTNDRPEIQISFLSAESATMKSNDGAYIFYFTVTNLRPKRAKLFVSPSCYTTQEGEEVDQDVWLAGVGNGGSGFTLSGGAFKKIGCVYYDRKFHRLSNGDKLLLTAWIENGNNSHEFLFECTDAPNKNFELLSSSLEPRAGDEEGSVSQSTPSKQKKEITKIIERLELLEEKFGIAISGLYSTCRYEPYGTPPYHEVKINFDLTSLSDGKLERSFNVIASAYNSAGQLLKTDSTRIYADDFMGFSPVSITLHLDQVPEKIRLFPAA